MSAPLGRPRKVAFLPRGCSWPQDRQSNLCLKMGKQEFDGRPSVIVVGAGAGGVATAARLAQAGCKVTLVEKNDFSGGRCSLIHRDGYV